MSKLLSFKETIAMAAYLYPDKEGVKDLSHSMTYEVFNARCCRLANGLLRLGLKKGDRFAALAYNRVEWLEFTGAAAKAGLVAVPIMFRLTPDEYHYILEDCGAKAFIIEEEFEAGAGSIRDKIDKTLASNYILLGNGDKDSGTYYDYEELLDNSPAEEPAVEVDAEDLLAILYTSGTTGKPKGAMRSHKTVALHNMVHSIEMGIGRDSVGLMVMPMCHSNSFVYSTAFLQMYGEVCVYSRKSFDPEELLRVFDAEGISWTSLVPTQYLMILSLPNNIKNKYDVSSLKSLICSSAPLRKTTKQEILEYFKNASFFEGYGSTEAGIPIMLRPEDQMHKLGSIGREMIGVDRAKILNWKGEEVSTGEIGEIYTKQPFTFEGYWKAPDKTNEAFCGQYFSAGDMGYRDEDGFYFLVDRKQNMIITGGENVYPSEVENVVITHNAVKEVAVIGVPDEKWGESIKAVVVLNEGFEGTEALKEQIIEFCRSKMAGYKRPRSVDFVNFEDIPRNATGKVLYTRLRVQYGRWNDFLDK